MRDNRKELRARLRQRGAWSRNRLRLRSKASRSPRDLGSTVVPSRGANSFDGYILDGDAAAEPRVVGEARDAEATCAEHFGWAVPCGSQPTVRARL